MSKNMKYRKFEMPQNVKFFWGYQDYQIYQGIQGYQGYLMSYLAPCLIELLCLSIYWRQSILKYSLSKLGRFNWQEYWCPVGKEFITLFEILPLLHGLEDTARYAGLLLAPAEGFGLRPRTFGLQTILFALGQGLELWVGNPWLYHKSLPII